ncbi:MAG: GatB/YqeY domain-containing protein [Pyrinomonadaceae bacterium]|nr:GatB/YqeY domain-containing protein [Pyrinomonadaceae bacterium]
MSLKEKITEDMKSAMRAKEKEELSVLRMVKSSITKQEKDGGEELTDEDVIKLLKTLVKQRRDSAEQYSKGGRPELADAELAEIDVIDNYLPAAATPEEIKEAVESAIAESGAESMKDMGKVMKLALAGLEGKNADGKAVSDEVRSKLA